MPTITIELSTKQCQAILNKASAEDLNFSDKNEDWENIPAELAHWKAALRIIRAEMEYQCSEEEEED